MENRLKELHHGLELDRTSCSRFLANQFRVLLTAAAYVLFQELQHRAHGTACADAQVTTLRERLLKVAVWVERSVRRVVLHLPTAFPGSAPGSNSRAPSAPLPDRHRRTVPHDGGTRTTAAPLPNAPVAASLCLAAHMLTMATPMPCAEAATVVYTAVKVCLVITVSLRE